jgi:hypothetical protein
MSAWTNHEIEKVRMMYIAQASEREIARALGKTKDAISSVRTRLIKAGRISVRTAEEQHRIQQRAAVQAAARRRGENIPLCAP